MGKESVTPESGQDYLRRLGEGYQITKKILPWLSDGEFESLKKDTLRKELGVESFLTDFAIADEERRRALERWTEGKKLPDASKEQVEAVRKALPAFVIVNPEAIGAMKVEPVRRYRIDIVVEDILNEIVEQLPRKIEAYRYHQGYAEDTIEVPGLGEVKVKMHETGDGIFQSISTVESDKFRIWNCRRSGVTYLDRLSDTSRPTDIAIKPLNLEIDLYADESGIFVGRNGKRYTNARWKTHFGRGYRSDANRDELYRTWSGPNPNVPSEGYTNKGWKEDKTQLSWKEIEGESIIWLVDNVLNPLRQAPRPEHQATTFLEEEPFPEGKVGPLFTFVRMEDMEKIVVLGSNPEKAYPDERKAVRPNKRLLSLDIPRLDVPEIAYDGFIWCGIGKIDDKTDIDKLSIGWQARRKDRLFGWNEGIAVVKPKTAADIYVVEWQEWDDYRNHAFRPGHDRLTNEEYHEMYRVVARTMVPITEYDGSYKNPVVLIGRILELDEIEALFFPLEEKTKSLE